MDTTSLIDRVVKCVINHNTKRPVKNYGSIGYVNDYSDPTWALNMTYWDWSPGVAVYGIFRAWKATGNPEYYEYMRNWVNGLMHKAYGVKTVNATAPLLTVLGLYEAAGIPDDLKVCIDAADWILEHAPRTREGGFEHTVNEAGPGFSEQIWADTLFMACIFLARLGRITGNPRYWEEAGKQLYIHHKLLKDKKTGVFYHGWNCESQGWMSGALWGRANAWITASTVEILEELPVECSGRKEIIDSLQEQVAALSRLQRPTGMFGTLLDHPDSYDETSATAGIAYGIRRGVRKGYLPKTLMEVVYKAEKAVMNSINEDGGVEGVSTGTPVMPSLEEYKTRERYPILYGQGLALLMLCESLKD